MAVEKQSELTRSQNTALWKAVEPAKLLEFLKRHDTHKADSKWIRKNGTLLQGRCRFSSHRGKDENPSLIVNIEKGYAKCHSCGGYTRSLPEVFSMISNLPVSESIKQLQSHFDVKVFKGKDIAASEDYQKKQLLKAKLVEILNEELDEAVSLYRTGGLDESELYFARPILDWVKQRGDHFLSYVSQLPIGIVTSSHRITKKASAKGYPSRDIEAMKSYMRDALNEHWIGALVFVNHVAPNEIGRLRIRKPDVVKDDGSTEKDMLAIDDADVSEIGLFGLGSGAGIVDAQEREPRLLLVEGEFDAMEVMVQQMILNDPLVVPVSHGGNAMHNLECLASTSFETVYYVPDKDHGGRANTKDILEANPLIDIRVFNWPLGLGIAGAASVDPKSCIDAHGFSAFRQEIREFESNYAKRQVWAKHEVEMVCKQFNAADSDDAKEISKIVQEYSLCVGDVNKVECSTKVVEWLTETLTQYGISSQQATASVVANNNPEIEFVYFIQLALEDRFKFIARTDDGATTVMWDRRRKQVMHLHVGSDTATKTELFNCLGLLSTWAPSAVPGGVPNFIKFSDTACKLDRTLISQEELLNTHVRMAIRQITPTLPELDSFTKYSDGNHWLKTSKGYRMFIVNGNLLFMGFFDDQERLQWEELFEPVYENYYFDLQKSKWSKNLVSLSALTSPPEVTLHDALMTNFDVINRGWSFVSQETEVMILAAWATALSVVKVFPTNLQFLASNERSSGKSLLYAELFGGGKNTSINIVEHTQYVDNVTPAGMRQAMDGSSRVLIIDEFDNQTGSRATQEKQEEVMLMLRTASGGQGEFMQGTTSGKPRIYRFSVSTMLAGIDPAMTEANQTRLITTDLQSGINGKVSPKHAIHERYTDDDITKIRKVNALSVFSSIPQITRMYKTIQKATQDDPAIFGSDVMQRFKDSLVVILAVLSAAGLDWKEWGTKICAAKASSLRKMNKATSNDDLLNDILHGDTNAKSNDTMWNSSSSVGAMIAEPATVANPAILNSINCGAWFVVDHDTKPGEVRYYLLVHWRRVATTILKWKKKWQVSLQQLQTIGDRHPKAKPFDDMISVISYHGDVPVWYAAPGESTMFDVTDRVSSSLNRIAAAMEHSASDEHLRDMDEHTREVMTSV